MYKVESCKNTLENDEKVFIQIKIFDGQNHIAEQIFSLSLSY